MSFSFPFILLTKTSSPNPHRLEVDGWAERSLPLASSNATECLHHDWLWSWLVPHRNLEVHEGQRHTHTRTHTQGVGHYHSRATLTKHWAAHLKAVNQEAEPPVKCSSCDNF